MPLPERLIVPVSVCRGTLQLPVPDELEGVTNGSLANIIRQLSTLSRHAEEMFGNLFQEAEGKREIAVPVSPCLTLCSLRPRCTRLQSASPDRQTGSQSDPAGLQRGGGDSPGDSAPEGLQVEPEF